MLGRVSPRMINCDLHRTDRASGYTLQPDLPGRSVLSQPPTNARILPIAMRQSNVDRRMPPPGYATSVRLMVTCQ